jgi:23S rRNA (uracil1939-C5)-methyltransferase
LKGSQTEEILGGLLDGSPGSIEVVPSPEVWGYRNKIRAHVVRTSGRPRAAYNRPGSRTAFVEVDVCHLASEAANAVLAGAVEASGTSADGPAEIEVRESRTDGEFLLNVYWKRRPEARALDPFVTGVVPRFPIAGLTSFFEEKGRTTTRSEWGRTSIRARVGKADFEIGPACFFQVNESILPRVVADMTRLSGWKGGERIADLYGGLGTFGLSLAKAVAAVFVVEPVPDNVRSLERNIGLNGAQNVTVCAGTSEEWLPWLAERGLDAAIVDPPRKGLGPEVVRSLLDRPPERILYLSCNPTTLARDLKDLAGTYLPERVVVYDFFPHTPHIESLAILSRR